MNFIIPENDALSDYFTTMKTNTNIPVLRFPEFEGEWVLNSFENISENVMYGLNASAIKFDGKHKYLRITDIDEGTREFKPNPLSSPAGRIDEQYKLKEADIVFARTGASVGKTYLYKDEDGDLYFAGFLIKFSILNSNPYFVYIQTLRDDYKRWITVMSMRSGQPGINAEEYKSLKFKFPSLPEQQKIASFFTAIDRKINLLKRKLTLLEQYKKGVMQKIFSQEIRFKRDDGGDFGEWEKGRLGDYANFFSGGTPMTTKKEYYGGDIPFIKSGEINLSSTEQFLSEQGLKESSAKLVEIGDILFALYGATSGEVAISKLKGAINQAVLCIRTKGSNYFVYSYLRYKKNDIILRYLQGGQGNLSAEIVRSIEVSLPSLPEQTKIASFLSAIDEKITGTRKQIEKAEQWKKGLMQQMFV